MMYWIISKWTSLTTYLKKDLEIRNVYDKSKLEYKDGDNT